MPTLRIPEGTAENSRTLQTARSQMTTVPRPTTNTIKALPWQEQQLNVDDKPLPKHPGKSRSHDSCISGMRRYTGAREALRARSSALVQLRPAVGTVHCSEGIGLLPAWTVGGRYFRPRLCYKHLGSPQKLSCLHDKLLEKSHGLHIAPTIRAACLILEEVVVHVDEGLPLRPLHLSELGQKK